MLIQAQFSQSVDIRLVKAFSCLSSGNVCRPTRSNPTVSTYLSLFRVSISVPPPAAERLEQRCRVGIARCLRLDQVDPRLLVLAFCVQKRQIAHPAQLELLLGKFKCTAGGLVGVCLRLKRFCVRIECAKHVGHILERLQNNNRYCAIA